VIQEIVKSVNIRLSNYYLEIKPVPMLLVIPYGNPLKIIVQFGNRTVKIPYQNQPKMT